MLKVCGGRLAARTIQVTRQVGGVSYSQASRTGNEIKCANQQNLVCTSQPVEGSLGQSGSFQWGPPAQILQKCMKSVTATQAVFYQATWRAGPVLQLKNTQGQYKEYWLPSHITNSSKNTILDPAMFRVLELPSGQSVILEKITPPCTQATPKTDPNPLQHRRDQGAPPLQKVCLPWLVTIRHKKMKKHKLKKLRKRMLFVRRKRKHFKRKRRELAIQAKERELGQIAEEFDAQKSVAERMALAHRGGWKVDPFVTHRQT